jgi:hypothetical protein
MDEAGVNYGIGLRGSGAETFEILEITAVDLGAGGLERPGGGIRAGEAEHLMAGGE